MKSKPNQVTKMVIIKERGSARQVELLSIESSHRCFVRSDCSFKFDASDDE